MGRMTSTLPETPDLTRVPGIYGGRHSVSHVRNLLARAQYATANGLTPEIVRRMRRHYQVASCLIVQSLPLIRADWSIESEDPDQAEKLTEAYKAIAFTAHRSMTRALWAGFSPNGIVWGYRPDLGGIYPTEIRDLAPETCKPLTDDLGTLDGFVQTISGRTDEIEPLYALWIVEGLESGNYYGRSILEAALDPFSDYAAFRAFHARYLERFGEPLVLCRAPAGKSIANAVEIEQAVANGEDPPAPQLVDNLDTALNIGQSLRHHSVVALPADLLFGADGKPTGFAWGLEFVTAKGGSGTDFLEAIRETDKRVARAMFVPDLLTTNTEDVGSNALGQTHRTVWTESVEGRLDDYSRQITDQLITPARLLNFGPDSPPARLVFAPLADEQLDRWWSLAETLVAGGRLPVDVIEIGEKLGIPIDLKAIDAADPEPPTTDEPDADLSRAAARATGRRLSADVEIPGPELDRPGTLVASTHDAAAGGGWIDFLSADPVAGLPDWKIPQAYDPPPWRRPLNAREERVGFARLEETLNATEAAAISALLELLDTEHDRVLKQLAGIMRKGTTAEILAALGTIEIKGGPVVVREWSALMAAVSDEALAGLRLELPAYAEQLPTSLGAEGTALFRSYASTSADRALSGLLTEVRLNLLNAFTSGVSRSGLAAIVGQLFDAHQTSEGKPLRLTTRMLSAKALNYSRAAAVERGGIPLAGAQYSAVLDRRTCELCEDLDEQVIAIESTDLARFTPPVHHNCRCVWVWITREEADFTPTWKTPAPSKVDRFGGLVF